KSAQLTTNLKIQTDQNIFRVLRPILANVTPMQGLLIFLVLMAPPQTVAIRGKVLDSRTLEPIEKALISIRDRKIETRTGANGEFELRDVSPGEVELYVTTVGYALVRKKLEVAPLIPVEIEILLGPEVLRRTDEISVTEKPFVAPEPASVSDHRLTQ